MQELRIVTPESLEAGMMLAQDILKDGRVLVKEGNVVTSILVEKIRGAYTGKLKVYVTIEDPAQDQDGSQNSGADGSKPSALPVNVYKKGDYICKEGDLSQHIYILQSGSLEVLVSKANKNTFKTFKNNFTCVGIIETPGTSFGEIGAITGTARTASIRASSEAKVISIQVSDCGLENTILGNPGLGISIAINLAKRLKENNTKIKGLLALLVLMEERLTFFVRSYVTICQGLGQAAATGKDPFLENIYSAAKNSQLYSLGIARKRDKTEAYKSEAVNVIAGSNRSSIINIDANENLFSEGDPGDTMYILTSGKLAEYVGTRQVGLIDTKGEVIGEITTLLGHASGKYGKRVTTIKALLDSQVLAVPGKSIETLVKHDPAVMVHIVKTLSKRLPVSNQKLMDCMQDYTSAMQKLMCFNEFKELSDNMRDSNLNRELEKQIRLAQLIYLKMSETAEQIDNDYKNLMA
jgi:CRP-like cAMP-binding protein